MKFLRILDGLWIRLFVIYRLSKVLKILTKIWSQERYQKKKERKRGSELNIAKLLSSTEILNTKKFRLCGENKGRRGPKISTYWLLPDIEPEISTDCPLPDVRPEISTDWLLSDIGPEISTYWLLSDMMRPEISTYWLLSDIRPKTSGYYQTYAVQRNGDIYLLPHF